MISQEWLRLLTEFLFVGNLLSGFSLRSCICSLCRSRWIIGTSSWRWTCRWVIMSMRTRYLCDVIDDIDIVIDGLVWHVLSTLITRWRYLPIIDSFHVGWLAGIQVCTRGICSRVRVISLVSLRIVETTRTRWFSLACRESVRRRTQRRCFRRRLLQGTTFLCWINSSFTCLVLILWITLSCSISNLFNSSCFVVFSISPWWLKIGELKTAGSRGRSPRRHIYWGLWLRILNLCF